VADVWYGQSLLQWPLLPLSWLYGLVTSLRRALYRYGVFRRRQVGVPVIVVGNVTAGGTGKTPVTIWLSRALRHSGWQPGIVSRGYRGNTGPQPVAATPDSDPAVVGDEAILLARESDCPVAVHPDRVAAARKVIAQGANLVIADDGLQHYRLARDIEIAVVDGTRGFGNGRLLPAGPLREPVRRLAAVDRVLVQRPPSAPPGPDLGLGDEPLGFHLDVSGVCSLDGSQTRHIADFAGRTVHAVAGIGHPQRFFGMLESLGLDVLRHPLPDHAPIRTSDLAYADGNPVFMTEKDAVKCRSLNVGDCWYVPVDVEFEGGGAESLLTTVLAALQAYRGDAS